MTSLTVLLDTIFISLPVIAAGYSAFHQHLDGVTA